MKKCRQDREMQKNQVRGITPSYSIWLNICVSPYIRVNFFNIYDLATNSSEQIPNQCELYPLVCCQCNGESRKGNSQFTEDSELVFSNEGDKKSQCI
jgi:hypothetical protein